MGRIAEEMADRIIVTSDNPRGENPETIIAAIVAGLARPGNVERLVDRRAAIRRAIAEAGPDDTVLIAGKGHEDYQQVGAERLPFDDAAEARLALRQWGAG